MAAAKYLIVWVAHHQELNISVVNLCDLSLPAPQRVQNHPEVREETWLKIKVFMRTLQELPSHS